LPIKDLKILREEGIEIFIKNIIVWIYKSIKSFLRYIFSSFITRNVMCSGTQVRPVVHVVNVVRTIVTVTEVEEKMQ